MHKSSGIFFFYLPRNGEAFTNLDYLAVKKMPALLNATDAIYLYREKKLPRKLVSTSKILKNMRRHKIKNHWNKKTSQSKQITLEVTEEHVRKLGTSDARAQRITHRVAEMVTLDCQPLSIIEDTDANKRSRAAIRCTKQKAHNRYCLTQHNEGSYSRSCKTELLY